MSTALPIFVSVAIARRSPALDPLSESAAESANAETSNWGLVRRMLGLGWRYRWGCLGLLLLQGLLLFTAITTLRLTGLGIDLIRFHVKATPTLPPYPLQIGPPASWSPMAQVAFLAGTILVLELIRGSLNYVYALSAGTLIHT